MSSSIVLTYVNGRGRAEAIRFVMAAAGLTWSESFLETKDDLDRLRASGKVPLVEIDGVPFTQSLAIIQHIARVHDLYGSNHLEAARIDAICDAIRDSSAFVGWVFQPDKSNFEETQIKPRVAKYFPMFESLAAANSSSSAFLVGDKLSFVDALLLNELEWTIDLFGASGLDAYPHLKAFRERIRALPVFATFLASPLRKPVPDDAYVQIVKAVFH